MTNNNDRVELIKSRLQQAFSPTQLEVIDESDQHIGHAGHQGGGRHFAISIASEQLQALTRVEAHRRVYAVFADLMPEKIHALRINIIRK